MGMNVGITEYTLAVITTDKNVQYGGLASIGSLHFGMVTRLAGWQRTSHVANRSRCLPRGVNGDDPYQYVVRTTTTLNLYFLAAWFEIRNCGNSNILFDNWDIPYSILARHPDHVGAHLTGINYTFPRGMAITRRIHRDLVRRSYLPKPSNKLLLGI